MLSLPRYTRSLLDSLDDDFAVLPMDYLLPSSRSLQQQQRQLAQQAQLAVPHIKNNKFNVNLDLGHFDPSEISVKFEDNTVKVHGKREKKSEDGKHYELREYQHQFSVPDNVLTDQLKCQLNKQGLLKIEAPVQGAVEEHKQHNIPIEFVKN